MAKAGKKGARARTQRRVDERAARQLVRDRERLAALEPGGTPDRPIAVETPAVIEAQVADQPCIQCTGRLRVDEHAVDVHGGVHLRVVRARCLGCGTPRVRWFKVEPPRPN
jgi:hypothetical protein